MMFIYSWGGGSLLQYWPDFDREGYDNMNQLLQMTPDELEEALAQDVGIKKKGHLKRVKALLAIHSATKNPKGTEHQDKDVKKSCNKTQICTQTQT